MIHSRLAYCATISSFKILTEGRCRDLGSEGSSFTGGWLCQRPHTGAELLHFVLDQLEALPYLQRHRMAEDDIGASQSMFDSFLFRTVTASAGPFRRSFSHGL